MKTNSNKIQTKFNCFHLKKSNIFFSFELGYFHKVKIMDALVSQIQAVKSKGSECRKMELLVKNMHISFPWKSG